MLQKVGYENSWIVVSEMSEDPFSCYKISKLTSWLVNFYEFYLVLY